MTTSINDIPNVKVRQKLEELQSTTNPKDFKQLAAFNCSMRFKAGYTKPIVTIEDKASLIHYICLHHTLLYSLPHIEQLINGLQLYGLLEIVRQIPEKSRMLFQVCEGNRLTAEIVDELFKVQFSQKEVISDLKRKPLHLISPGFWKTSKLVQQRVNFMTSTLNTVQKWCFHLEILCSSSMAVRPYQLLVLSHNQ